METVDWQQPIEGGHSMDTITLLIYIAGGIFALWFILFLTGIRYIPNNKVGIVEKRWSSKGSLKIMKFRSKSQKMLTLQATVSN
jgi:uncharacterized membrane protein YqiK